MKIFLKTYFYTPNEINYINLNLQESYDKVDKFIVCEFNITHTGFKREYIFENYQHLINPLYADKLVYLKCDIKDITRETENDANIIHNINEKTMRGYFVKCFDFNDDDIIISVDCDEIIYNQYYDEIIEEVKKRGTVQLKLNQLFYKPNYHWTDCNFIAPVASKYERYKNEYPSNWRYDGVLINKFVGCHFSWCMSVDEMIYKLNTYSHPEYKSFANKEVLKNAIERKIYPFDLRKPFTINIIDRTSEILPKSIQDTFYDKFWKKFN